MRKGRKWAEIRHNPSPTGSDYDLFINNCMWSSYDTKEQAAHVAQARHGVELEDIFYSTKEGVN